jgi:hypothetical protein
MEEVRVRVVGVHEMLSRIRNRPLQLSLVFHCDTDELNSFVKPADSLGLGPERMRPAVLAAELSRNLGDDD